MKKTILMIVSVIILLATSITIGYYIYKTQIAKEQNIAKNNIEENIVREERNITIEQVNTQEEKVTPNTEFVLKEYYKTCGHTTINYVEIPSKIVNMTEEELQHEYPDW